MGAFLKNIALTAIMVAGATIAATIVAVIVSMLVAPSETTAMPNAVAFTFAMLIVVVLALLVGMFFCLLTLFIAAVTMPPVIYLARWLSLPRPAVDVVGGAMAAWLCAAAGLDESGSLMQYGLTFPEPICVGVAVAFGALLGYLRFRVLVRPEIGANMGPALPAV